MRSIHFRVSDEMYILIQQGAEDAGASVAHFSREAAIARAVLSEARRATDPLTRARATVSMATWAVFGEHELPFDEREAWRNEARSVFESTGDDYGLALYWSGMAWEAWYVIRATEAAQACEHSLEYFRRAGAEGSRAAASIRHRLRASYYQGPTPVDQGRSVAPAPHRHCC